MRELRAILRDIRSGALSLHELPSLLIWRVLRSASEAFL